MAEPSLTINSPDLCLHFANTWGRRLEEPVDRPPGYPELVAWADQNGILAPGRGHHLLERAGRDPARAGRVAERAAQLREAVHQGLSRVARGLAPRDEELGVINRVLADGMKHLELRAVGPGCRWEWSAPPDALDQMLWPVALSAAGLLTSDRAGRVRECAAEDCAWLFIDGSRNRRRKWCDMASCGNRAKARRYYERHRRA